MIEVKEDVLILDGDTEQSAPKMYVVILHNDDYTAMDFVVRILMTVFGHPPKEAEALMLHVHHHGHAICGRFSYDIALSKIALVHSLARGEQYPLRCSLKAE